MNFFPHPEMAKPDAALLALLTRLGLCSMMNSVGLILTMLCSKQTAHRSAHRVGTNENVARRKGDSINFY
jgi:hypothetical protein